MSAMTHRVRQLAASLLLLTVPAMAWAVDAVTARFYGYAYDLDSVKYLYTEVHEQRLLGERWLGGKIRYFSPDGREIGAKTLDFAANPYVPVYDYQLPALHYREAITAVGDQIAMLKSRGDKTRTATVDNTAPIAADSGFHSFLRAHFQELLDGKTVTFTFVAAGNLDSYKFRAKRIEDTTFEGHDAVRFKVEANSLLRLVAPDLYLTYDPGQQRLLEYRGPSNVIDPKTDEVYKTRIVYPSQTPADAPKNLPPLG
jgi:hypothetical protein